MLVLLQAWLFLTIGFGAALVLVVALQVLVGGARRRLAVRTVRPTPRPALAQRSG